MRRISAYTLTALCLLTLAACGADAPPTAPGVKVEGEMQMGVVVK